jgi:hypothetical protein
MSREVLGWWCKLGDIGLCCGNEMMTGVELGNGESCCGVLDNIRNRGLRWGTGSRKDDMSRGMGIERRKKSWFLGFVIRIVVEIEWTVR